MQKILYTIAAIILLAAFTLPPRSTKVVGKVVDEHGAPIHFATVQEKGRKNGVSSKADGSFSILVSSTKAILRVQAIGYSTTYFLIKDTLSLTLVLQDPSKTCFNSHTQQTDNLATTLK